MKHLFRARLRMVHWSPKQVRGSQRKGDFWYVTPGVPVNFLRTFAQNTPTTSDHQLRSFEQKYCIVL